MTRDSLFRAYMEKHCQTRDGKAFQLNANEFLARGEDTAGKRRLPGLQRV